MLPGFATFDTLSGVFVETVKQTFQAAFITFNFLDPFALVRASRRLQTDFFELIGK
jgi:hypothetical protein